MKQKPDPKPTKANDFESVAKRLGCDPNLKAFDAKLKKIAKAKASTLIRPKVHR